MAHFDMDESKCELSKEISCKAVRDQVRPQAVLQSISVVMVDREEDEITKFQVMRSLGPGRAAL